MFSPIKTSAFVLFFTITEKNTGGRNEFIGKENSQGSAGTPA
jgi:hypothetical protein